MTTTKTTLEYRSKVYDDCVLDQILVVQDGVIQSKFGSVDRQLFAEFQATEGHEDNWHGDPNSYLTRREWDALEDATDAEKSAYRDWSGVLVATSTDGQLTIVNDELWASRLAFMLQTGE